jgi:molecular chaperone DnaJ
MNIKDYYNILETKEDASQDEIKKAYRRLAKKFHPDANPGNKQAEERFKEISESYEILSGPQKRRQYDQMKKFGFRNSGQGFDFDNFDLGSFRRQGRTAGPEGFSFNGFDIVDELDEFIHQFVYGGNGFKRSKSTSQQNKNLSIEISVPLELSVRGGEKDFSIYDEKICPACGGGGARPGSSVVTCPDCMGRGTLSMDLGISTIGQQCPRCYGKGQIIKNPCNRCNGKGKINAKQTYSVKLPPGISDGEKIRLKRQNHFGTTGCVTRDIIIKIHVEPHHFFERRGDDIYCKIKLNQYQAALGSKVKIKRIDGKQIQLKIPAGTQNSTIFRMPNMGVERNGRKGDQYITVFVDNN